MREDVVNALLKLLERVDIKGSEVDVFNFVRQELKDSVDKKEKEVNGKESREDS